MEHLDASPRASKRRRTATYATSRRTVASSPPESVHETERETKEATPNNRGRRVLEQRGQLSEDESSKAINGKSTIAPTGEENAAEGTPRRGSGRRTKAIEGVSEPVSDVPTNTHKKGEIIDQNLKEGREHSQDGLRLTMEDSEHEEEESTASARPRSSTRIRRPSRRLQQATEESPLQASKRPKKSNGKHPVESVSSQPVSAPATNSVLSPQPKGILTPSRHGRRGKARKSVAFEGSVDDDQRQIEEQFGFKDIAQSTKKTAKNRSKHVDSSKAANRTEDQQDPEDALENIDSPPENGDPEDQASLLEEEIFDINDIISVSQVSDIPPPGNVTAGVIVDEDPHLTNIKLQILSRITDAHSDDLSLTPSPVPSHLQTQYDTLHTLLTATVTSGESNSLLLLGSRGSGKSLLIRHTLSDLRKAYGDDFHVVKLNGFIQTDDKLALREIWRQLGREMAVPEDETGEVSSYADTMASLLSLLSHPEELAADSDAMAIDNTTATMDSGGVNRASKSVIFVLDEFDLFTTHPRQTLLYNLFDIAQARKAPIAVIGCSTRMDIVDCLEKRVKSRFSHRWLHIPAVKSLIAFEEVVRDVLCLPVDGKDALGVTKKDLDWRQKWNDYIKTQLLPASSTQTVMKRIFYATKSIPDMLAALYIPIATLSVPAADDLGVTELSKSRTPMVASTTSSPPSLLDLLPQLPILHLSLLVSGARLETIYDVTMANFTLIHKQYTELLARSKLQRSSSFSFTKAGAITGTGLRSWSRDTARAAWEDLAQWQYIVPHSGVGPASGAGRHGDEGLGGDGISSKMFRLDVTLDELSCAIKKKFGATSAGETLMKWCKEV
ncbi:hypothetical protein AYO21_01814 [Fonsecaea monophora]|uniref:Uncharacterized protein n=1 Tax=Fonsecaea monophora TaxID=254056 RepID=A0A177FKV6_9EURO|nr:hypothetical protein AYO21_01814 [Fonsecaea monophora]KAH0831616.1 origin recognition complex subunit 4 [Fonsecaea pedrosoi]OAG43962.1 hypothetical protein AYO21_01814 [Fonsecaea monophora]